MGTWAAPNTVEKATKLSRLFKKKITDINMIYNLVGDDEMYDSISDTTEKTHDIRDSIAGQIKIWLNDGEKNNFENWSYKWEPEAVVILKKMLNDYQIISDHYSILIVYQAMVKNNMIFADHTTKRNFIRNRLGRYFEETDPRFEKSYQLLTDSPIRLEKRIAQIKKIVNESKDTQMKTITKKQLLESAIKSAIELGYTVVQEDIETVFVDRNDMNTHNVAFLYPKIVTADDYHEFIHVEYILRELGLNLSCKELSSPMDDGYYYGLIYDTKNKEQVALFNKLNKEELKEEILKELSPVTLKSYMKKASKNMVETMKK
jgi:hypothetical protein